MIIALVLAVSENGVIGKDNALPWRLPADLRYFRKVTASYPLIMGRKTFDSVGRPLPGRRNIIITRQANFQIPGCDVVHTLDEAIQLAQSTNAPQISIVGGAEIFRQALPLATRIYLTRIHAEFEGDAFFAIPDPEKWKEVSRDDHLADAENPYSYSFIVYERKLSPQIDTDEHR
jgi:dihydrofolate reductase